MNQKTNDAGLESFFGTISAEAKSKFSECVLKMKQLLNDIRSSNIELDKADAMLDCMEQIAESYSLQNDYHEFKEEQPNEDLPSDEDVQSLKQLVSDARKEIEKQTN
ncbi:hypothetical protein ACFL6U_12975 [Planctomycetota bacterium]